MRALVLLPFLPRYAFLSAEVQEVLSTYAFVTYVSRAAAVVAAHPCLMARRKALLRRAAARERYLILLKLNLFQL